jgi:Trypsin-like peptidase domain
MNPPVVAPPSIMSLFVTAKVGELELGQGTAFMVEWAGWDWLITNWHIASGRNRLDGQPLHTSGATPDNLVVWHNAHSPSVGRHQWRQVEYELFDGQGTPKWFEHPRLGRRVDVVAFRVDRPSALAYYPYPIDNLTTPLAIGVAEDVNIVGFPFGIRGSGSMAVWSRGTIASEPDVDFDGLPCFLVDSRTRKGQSGAPVLMYSTPAGGHRTPSGLTFSDDILVHVLGVYSGRINPESDLGVVWKTQALRDVLDGGVRGNGDLAAPLQT